MSKVYTAQEMREIADGFLAGGVVSRVEDVNARYGVREYLDNQIIAILRQAADLMEREEKREKKYEFAVKWNDGFISRIMQNFPCQGELDAIRQYNLIIVRRPVGEWEEVKV